tara:strand:- start:714 stop:1415 length:702 start_codon:yes stop_codon:yes gene_type:complete
MDKIQFAIQQLRADPNNNKYTDEELISIYGLSRPSFTQGNTGILNNFSFPNINLPTSLGDVKNLGGKIMGGIMGAATGIPFLGPIIGNIAQPAVSDVMGRDYMAANYGLTDTGQIASGIMAGYNPVNLMGTGMVESIDKRLANIRNRKMPQTDASRQKIAELEKLQADLIANERAQTYSPVVTQEQKSYFSGSGDGGQGGQGGQGIGRSDAEATGRAAAAFRMAKGGIVSLYG